ncbi:hypothetical protein [Arsenophonus nasoniae]|uniref:Lipoprotein n=1 Tax=Arsenophonus nasoniae TaxID=638 RepID=A0AA95GSF6_9GAMM|nr:hypothetical protein [Arsenophonus nasoniae]WGM03942.1 hypothetical protein QE210_21125 [Arsenophonus nasoniae]WGM09139.1 hypothetical protein QE258_27680 [Arsenophonus nasoniae]
MRKTIGVMLIGLLSLFVLTSCDADKGQFSGTYQYEEHKHGEFGDTDFYERMILIKQNDGYSLERQVKSPTSTSDSIKFSPSEDLGSLKKEGNFFIKLPQNKKFFEIINENELKDVNNNRVFKRIRDEAN